MGEVGADFLKEKFDLHKAPEVEQAARRTEVKTGGRIPQTPEARIQNYLDRFKEITDRDDPIARERGIEAIKTVLLKKFVTKPDDIPKSYWTSQENFLRTRGEQVDSPLLSKAENDERKIEAANGFLEDQRASLEQWIDYLAGENSSYMPDYMKYWVFRSVVSLSEYDKEKREFPKRSKGTVKKFPDINHEALAYVVDIMSKKVTGEPFTMEQYRFDLTGEQRSEFSQYIAQENFAKLYGFANELISPIPEHLLPVTHGKWVKYDQGSDHMPLVQSIRGRGAGWCTAGETTAKSQLKNGDFYVYYTEDDDGNPTIPRIAIRMQGSMIGEVRGIAARQNLDPYMGEVLAEKLNEFTDKKNYIKRDKDMKQLTAIDKKIKAGEELEKDELVFLYEVNSEIEGFGQNKDSRINELRNTRDTQADALVIFDCQPEQIARSRKEINENTKIYIGELFPGIFDLLGAGVEHIYTNFPEKQIRRETMGIGGKSSIELQEELNRVGVNIPDSIKLFLGSTNFTTQEQPQDIELVRLEVKDLGLTGEPTTDQIFEKSKELGLELCPAEVGPQLCLVDNSSTIVTSIGMEQIIPSDSGSGEPGIFQLIRNPDNRDLYLSKASGQFGGYGWAPSSKFIFRLPSRTNSAEHNINNVMKIEKALQDMQNAA